MKLPRRRIRQAYQFVELPRRLIHQAYQFMELPRRLIRQAYQFTQLLSRIIPQAWDALHRCGRVIFSPLLLIIFVILGVNARANQIEFLLGFASHLGELAIGVAAFTALTLQYASVCDGKEALMLKASGRHSLKATCWLASAFLLRDIFEISKDSIYESLISVAILMAGCYFVVGFSMLSFNLFWEKPSR